MKTFFAVILAVVLASTAHAQGMAAHVYPAKWLCSRTCNLKGDTGCH